VPLGVLGKYGIQSHHAGRLCLRFGQLACALLDTQSTRKFCDTIKQLFFCSLRISFVNSWFDWSLLRSFLAVKRISRSGWSKPSRLLSLRDRSQSWR
jgi:hypothetical protein